MLNVQFFGFTGQSFTDSSFDEFDFFIKNVDQVQVRLEERKAYRGN
jgi:hypothetical protein